MFGTVIGSSNSHLTSDWRLESAFRAAAGLYIEPSFRIESLEHSVEHLLDTILNMELMVHKKGHHGARH